MIAEWIVMGVSWGVKISSMIITLLAVAGVVLGILRLIFGGRGNDNENQNTENNDTTGTI